MTTRFFSMSKEFPSGSRETMPCSLLYTWRKPLWSRPTTSTCNPSSLQRRTWVPLKTVKDMSQFWFWCYHEVQIEFNWVLTLKRINVSQLRSRVRAFKTRMTTQLTSPPYGSHLQKLTKGIKWIAADSIKVGSYNKTFMKPNVIMFYF